MIACDRRKHIQHGAGSRIPRLRNEQTDPGNPLCPSRIFRHVIDEKIRAAHSSNHHCFRFTRVFGCVRPAGRNKVKMPDPIAEMRKHPLRGGGGRSSANAKPQSPQTHTSYPGRKLPLDNPENCWRYNTFRLVPAHTWQGREFFIISKNLATIGTC